LLRVLLDECLPKKLKREFVNCAVSTVTEMGWAGKRNGELMSVAYGQFDVFVTADQNLQYQQNLAYAEVGVIVLVAFNNRIETLAPLMPQVNEVLKNITAGQVIEIEAEVD
jgi:predicted nuclease of predicted toxin-antitoxin system